MADSAMVMMGRGRGQGWSWPIAASSRDELSVAYRSDSERTQQGDCGDICELIAGKNLYYTKTSTLSDISYQSLGAVAGGGPSGCALFSSGFRYQPVLALLVLRKAALTTGGFCLSA